MTTTRQAPRKRRRPPRSDWQFPILTDLGMDPKKQKLLVIGASVAGVLAAAVVLVLVITSLGSGYTPERRASAAILQADASLPEVYHSWSSPKLFDPIAERDKDRAPLTEKEVFGQKTLADQGKSADGKKRRLTLKLAVSKVDADCAAAVWGEELLELVQGGGCNQAARGVYLSSDGRYIGQYTLLNLRDGKAATQVVEELKTLYRGGWARPLGTGRSGFPPGAHTEGGGYALGHYVGMVWIGRADGAAPTAKDDFVSFSLTLRGAEKAVYRRVVSITGPAS
ncbi:hypothetical protein [Nonomuraea rhizosphaerae]|uniref:hypothetical protein n=1 Tax=Nonomuraea rhizosphaerae TaxID=2665663 RepID=UPI001C5F59B6|nr:hypothetical protein [Nonomuraea rhizosphaerae]